MRLEAKPSTLFPPTPPHPPPLHRSHNTSYSPRVRHRPPSPPKPPTDRQRLIARRYSTIFISPNHTSTHPDRPPYNPPLLHVSTRTSPQYPTRPPPLLSTLPLATHPSTTTCPAPLLQSPHPTWQQTPPHHKSLTYLTKTPSPHSASLHPPIHPHIILPHLSTTHQQHRNLTLPIPDPQPCTFRLPPSAPGDDERGRSGMRRAHEGGHVVPEHTRHGVRQVPCPRLPVACRKGRRQACAPSHEEARPEAAGLLVVTGRPR